MGPGICSSLLGCGSMGIARTAVRAGWARCYPSLSWSQTLSFCSPAEFRDQVFYSDIVDLL